MEETKKIKDLTAEEIRGFCRQYSSTCKDCPCYGCFDKIGICLPTSLLIIKKFNVNWKNYILEQSERMVKVTR